MSKLTINFKIEELENAVENLMKRISNLEKQMDEAVNQIDDMSDLFSKEDIIELIKKTIVSCMNTNN